MLIIFATVGTTSFDNLVSSLCSQTSLSTMAAEATHHLRHRQKTLSPSKHSLSSSPLASAQSSTLTSPVETPLEQSCSTSVRSFSSYPLSSSGHGDESSFTLELIIQYGKGKCPLSFIPPSLQDPSVDTNADENDDSGSTTLMIPTEDDNNCTRLYVKWYRFQPSLLQDMKRADIILCHAGAGTLMEAMAIRRNQKLPPIINAVINSTLMNNHQSELAEELEKRNHITVTYDCISEWTSEEKASFFWKKLGDFQPIPFSSKEGCVKSKNNASSFQKIVDGVMCFGHVHKKSKAESATIKKHS